MIKVFRKKLGLILVVLSLIIVSCKKENIVIKNEVNITPVTVKEVKKSDYYEYGEYYGRVQGVKRSSIINILGGTVESVDVVEGSDVKIGDSLAKISPDKALLSYNSAKLNEKISRENYQTLKKFLTNGNSSQIDVDKAHLAWLNSKTQLIDAEKAYEAAYCIAQINGTVVLRNINKEDEIRQGQEVFLIEDLSKIEIKIGIPEADMEGINEGSRAEVSLDLFPGRVWEGSLVRHSRRSSDNNLTFSATIVVDNEDYAILSGTTAKVRILRNSYEDHIILPSSVILNEDGNHYIMVVEPYVLINENGDYLSKMLKEDVVSKVAIVVGAANVDETVVLSGVNVGDVVVQEGLHLLTEGQQVKITNEGV